MKTTTIACAALLSLSTPVVADVYLYVSDTKHTGDFTTGDGDDNTQTENANAVCRADKVNGINYDNNVALISFKDHHMKDVPDVPNDEIVRVPDNTDPAATLAASLTDWYQDVTSTLPNIVDYIPDVTNIVYTFSDTTGHYDTANNCANGTLAETSKRGQVGSPTSTKADWQKSIIPARCIYARALYCVGWNDPKPPTPPIVPPSTPIPSSPVQW